MRLALERLVDLTSGPGLALLQATERLGFSTPVAREGLLAELEAWSHPEMMAELIARADALKERNAAPSEVLIIATRTLPASTLRHTLFARLVGAQVTIKAARGQLDIAEAIAEADPSISALSTEVRETARWAEVLRHAQCVIALGGDDTITSIKQGLNPASTLVGFGHRVSAAWLNDPDDDAILGVAEDLCAWDQAGCLSPQVVWTTSSPRETAAAIADAVRHVESRLPMTLPLQAGTTRGEMKTFGEMMGGISETHTSLIVHLNQSDLRYSPGYRALWVLEASRGALEAAIPRLSTLAVSGECPVELGHAVRLCHPGQMQKPTLLWAQDGHLPVSSLARQR